MIKLTLKDGSIKEVERHQRHGCRKEISMGLTGSLRRKINGEVKDLRVCSKTTAALKS